MPNPIGFPQEPLLACHDCDALYPRPQLRPGQKACCLRCGAVLLENKPNGRERCLALSLASLVLLLVANVFPLLSMNIEGRVQQANVISGVFELYRQGFGAMAALVFGVSVLAPALKLLAILYVLLPLRFRRPLPYAARVFRMVETLRPWSMTEVYMLGILVAVVKLADLATIEPGVALYCFTALILLMAAADAALEPEEIWERLEPRP
jgi:paraquat-inducible protein A